MPLLRKEVFAHAAKLQKESDRWNDEYREVFRISVRDWCCDKKISWNPGEKYFFYYDEHCDSGFFYGGYKTWLPTHKKNKQLEFLYETLRKLGYRISSEEQALIDGTHELFKVGEKSEKSDIAIS